MACRCSYMSGDPGPQHATACPRWASRPAEPESDGASQPTPVSRDAVSGAQEARTSRAVGPKGAVEER